MPNKNKSFNQIILGKLLTQDDKFYINKILTLLSNVLYYQMLIIGIYGGTGSGKTTIVNKIGTFFSSNDIEIISQDSYYKDNSDISYEDRCKINFDHPDAIDFNLDKKDFNSAIFTDKDEYWIADRYNGLLHKDGDFFESIKPSGPFLSDVGQIINFED